MGSLRGGLPEGSARQPKEKAFGECYGVLGGLKLPTAPPVGDSPLKDCIMPVPCDYTRSNSTWKANGLYT